jgi:uncharacterized protein YigA (DUF484 family)
MSGDLRARLMSDPEMILEDRDLMRALITANERAMGANIVDLRGIAMKRLEARLDRLEDTHRSVIAAAYENLAGTNQIHRAVLKMLDPTGFEDFLKNLGGEVAQILKVDSLRLVLETQQEVSDDDPALTRLGAVLHVAPPGFIEDYMRGGRASAARTVVLRQTGERSAALYGEAAEYIRSEALLRLDFGSGRLPGLLVLGAEDPHQFRPNQGTDLLGFFASVFERAMRRWLA